LRQIGRNAFCSCFRFFRPVEFSPARHCWRITALQPSGRALIPKQWIPCIYQSACSSLSESEISSVTAHPIEDGALF
jgi:hypothetical protein